MKEDFDDIEFKQLFQEKAHKPGENRWFTPRLLNRLPEKNQTVSNIFTIERWAYVIGLLLCTICWGFLFRSGYFDVITVRTLIYTVALVVGSFALAIQTLRNILSL